MASITITVNRRGSSTNIYLTDSENHGVGQKTDNITTEVSPGDFVQWLVGDGISSIEGITEKSGSNNLFLTAPTAANNWQGSIGNFPAGTEEEYYISYKVENDTNTYKDDPKLKMKV